MTNSFFYLVTILIWGSTWLAVKFQLGIVSPELSVAYRITLATLLLFIFSALRRLPLRFTWRQHAFMALQGFFLFSFNYYVIYQAATYLTSGLVAILFSMLTISNVIFGAIFLRAPIRVRVVIGSITGILGMMLIFGPELVSFDLSNGSSLGFIWGGIGVIFASLGNIVSAHNQRQGLPVIQTNAYGMAYGALFMLFLVIISGTPLTFDFSPGYVVSLLYLALFGSVIAFGSYLTLLGRIGADRAAYVTVLFPIIALILSTIFEGMSWSLAQFAGVVLVLIGNVIVLTKIKAKQRIASLSEESEGSPMPSSS